MITEVDDDYSVAEPQKGTQSQAHENDSVRPTSNTTDKPTSSTAEVRNGH